MATDEVIEQYPQFFRAGEDLDDDDFLAPADELLGFEE